ncbi:MAG: PH domain-containing protein [Balneolales bacterium]
MNNKSYELRPDWRIYLIPYVIGALLIPVLGAGILVIRHFRRKWKNIRYLITDSDIRLRDGAIQTKIPLLNITSCDTAIHPIQKKFGLGDILVYHDHGISVLRGIADPDPIAGIIEQAAESERKRSAMRQDAVETAPPHPSGTLDKKNELVGLWQQGLLSEDDYRNEIKKFE